MKSAYELAMERLQASEKQPVTALTNAQKADLADIDKRFDARLAERKIFLEQRRLEAVQKRDAQEVARVDLELRREKERIDEDRESEKNKVRNAKR